MKKIYVLEFSPTVNEICQLYSNYYSLKVIPYLGKIANNKDAYKYLIESIKEFPQN